VGVRVSDAPEGEISGLTGAIVGPSLNSVGEDVTVMLRKGSGSQGSAGLAVGAVMITGTEGWVVGLLLGALVGDLVGEAVVGGFVGRTVGEAVGALVGLIVGLFVGLLVGFFVGTLVGETVGALVGLIVGAFVGTFVGEFEGTGESVGTSVGWFGEHVGVASAAGIISTPKSISSHQHSLNVAGNGPRSLHRMSCSGVRQVEQKLSFTVRVVLLSLASIASYSLR